MTTRTEVERLVTQLQRGGISRRDFVYRAMGQGAPIPDLGTLRAVPLYGGWPWFLPLVDGYYRVRDRFG